MSDLASEVRFGEGTARFGESTEEHCNSVCHQSLTTLIRRYKWRTVANAKNKAEQQDAACTAARQISLGA